MLNVSFHECLDVIHKKPATMFLWWHVMVSTHNHEKGGDVTPRGATGRPRRQRARNWRRHWYRLRARAWGPTERRRDDSAGSRTPTLWQVSRSQGTSPGHAAPRPLGPPRSPRHSCASEPPYSSVGMVWRMWRTAADLGPGAGGCSCPWCSRGPRLSTSLSLSSSLMASCSSRSLSRRFKLLWSLSHYLNQPAGEDTHRDI